MPIFRPDPADSQPQLDLIEVIATRDPGEYLLRIGDQHYVELNGRREAVPSYRIAKLVSVPYWGWNLRRPGTAYPCTSWAPDYQMELADEPDDDCDDWVGSAVNVEWEVRDFPQVRPARFRVVTRMMAPSRKRATINRILRMSRTKDAGIQVLVPSKRAHFFIVMTEPPPSDDAGLFFCGEP